MLTTAQPATIVAPTNTTAEMAVTEAAGPANHSQAPAILATILATPASETAADAGDHPVWDNEGGRPGPTHANARPAATQTRKAPWQPR